MSNQDEKFAVTIHHTDGSTNIVGQIAVDARAAVESVAEGLDVEIDSDAKVTSESDVSHFTVVADPNLVIQDAED